MDELDNLLDFTFWPRDNYQLRVTKGAPVPKKIVLKCPSCKITKIRKSFIKNQSHYTGVSGYCQDCMYEKMKNSYRAKYRHSEKGKTTESAYNQRNRPYNSEKSKERMAKYKEFVFSLKVPCCKCGETRPYIIDFHRVDPLLKEVNIGRGALGKGRLLNEVRKCVCLCRNCHFEFHYLYGNVPDDSVGALMDYLGLKEREEIPYVKPNS